MVDADCTYRVYGLVQDKRKNIERYVADGPAHFIGSPITAENLKDLARRIDVNHMDFLKAQNNSMDTIDYLGFSFDLMCDVAIYEGKIYRTQRLSEKEQGDFIQKMRKDLSRYFRNAKKD